MLRTKFICLIAIAAALQPSGAEPNEESAAGPPPLTSTPNFIVILTDDLGYGDLACYGNQVTKSPRLDRMAKQGIRFTDFYVPAAQCTPTRAAFLTGSYPQRINSHRLFGDDGKGISPDEVTIAELLQEQGYRTGCIGKWHLGAEPLFNPNNHGFDYFYGFQNPSYGDKTKRLIHRNKEVVATGPESSRITDDLTGEAVKFIHRNKENPFFLYLAHDMPHVPLELTPERRGISKGGFYGDVIEHLDWSVGQVMDALADNDLEENTIVIFTSDNGPAIHWSIEAGTAYPLLGSKHTTCEGGFRVPGIAWGPGRIPSGRVSSEMVTIMDLLPTFIKLAGGTVPADRVIDGKDIWPVLSGGGGAGSPHEALFFYKRDKKAGHIEGVRSGNWKLRVPLKSYHDKAKQRKGDIELVECKIDEDGKLPTWDERKKIAISNLQKIQIEAAKEKVGLYNLTEDVGERVNLASKYPEKVKELRTLMERFDTRLRASSRACGDTRMRKTKP